MFIGTKQHLIAMQNTVRFSPRPPPFNHNHFPRSLISHVLFDLYLLLSALYPDSHSIHGCVSAKCMVFVTTASSFGCCCRFFYWVGQTFAHFFRLFRFFSSKTVLLSIHFVWLLLCVSELIFFRPLFVRLFLQDAQFSLPPHYVQRLNKLPKVYYVLLLFQYFIAFLCYCLHRLRQYTTATAAAAVVFAEFFSTSSLKIYFWQTNLGSCVCLRIDFNGFLHALFTSSCRMYSIFFHVFIHHIVIPLTNNK